MKLIPTIPSPTTTIFFLDPPWVSFSDALTPSGPPSIGPPLISVAGSCGCQLAVMFLFVMPHSKTSFNQQQWSQRVMKQQCSCRKNRGRHKTREDKEKMAREHSPGSRMRSTGSYLGSKLPQMQYDMGPGPVRARRPGEASPHSKSCNELHRAYQWLSCFTFSAENGRREHASTSSEMLRVAVRADRADKAFGGK